MKKIIVIIISGFLIGVFGKNIYHSMVTGLNPIIAIVLLLILVSCFIFEIIYLYKNLTKKGIVLLAIVINLLFMGGFIYFDIKERRERPNPYFMGRG